MTSIMSWEQHHSKPVTKIGRGTQWSKTSRNGLPSLSVRSDFPRRKALTDAFIGVQPCNNGTGEDSKKDVKQCVKLPMDQEGFPILPTWEAIMPTTLSYKRSLISKYMTEMYRE